MTGGFPSQRASLVMQEALPCHDDIIMEAQLQLLQLGLVLTHWHLVDFNKVLVKWFSKFILAIDGWDISHEISSRWMSLDLTDKSILVQVMTWCRQATSHYLSQCWPRSLSPYGVTRQQWVNTMLHPSSDNSGTCISHWTRTKDAHVFCLYCQCLQCL